MSTIGLTVQSKRARDFIRGYINDAGIAPSFEEIAGALGVKSKSTVARIINQLVRDGHVRRVPHRIRGVYLVDDDEPSGAMIAVGCAVLKKISYDEFATGDEHVFAGIARRVYLAMRKSARV